MNVSDEVMELAKSMAKESALSHEPGDYAEEDENGVVWIRRKDGTPIMLLNRQDYLAIREQGLP